MSGNLLRVARLPAAACHASATNQQTEHETQSIRRRLKRARKAKYFQPMLYVKRELYALAESGELKDLQAALQNAMALEHATMPPYLYALFSFGGPAQSNRDIKRILRMIAEEEMLHMLLVGNLLKAIGGRPVIADPSFVISYPRPLPGLTADFEVPLQRFTLKLIEDVFMRIEEPEHPITFPSHPLAIEMDRPRTIGEFYRRIRKVFIEQPGLIAVTTGQPVSSDFEGRYNVKQRIESNEDAVKAIDFIVGQGEGTETDPFFEPGTNQPNNDKLAHYYRFAQIVKGRLKPNLSPPPNPKPEDLYFYDESDKMPFDASTVLPLRENPHAADFPEGSEARQKIDVCNRTYTEILKSLDAAFNVDTGRLDEAVNSMFNFTTAAQDVVSVSLGDNTRPGPSFEFLI